MTGRQGLFASVRKLVAGNGLAQGIQLAALPVLSRVFLPADFGVLAMVQSVASVIAIVATLQMHLSIPMSLNDRDLHGRVAALETLQVTWAALAVPAVVIMSAIAGALGAAAFAITVLTLSLAVANTYTSVLVYRGRFGLISLFSIARASFIVTLQLVFSRLEVPDGLVAGALGGEMLSALLLRSAGVGAGHPIRVTLRRTLVVVRRLRAFSLFGTLQELVSVATFYAPIFLFVSIYGTDVGGQYSMSSRLVWAPVVLLSGSIAQVLYHQLGRNPPTDVQALRALMPPSWMGIPLLAALIVPFFLEDLYALVLGSGWELAGRLIPLQVLWGCSFLLSLPARVVCRVCLFQRQQMYVDAGTLVAIVVLLTMLGTSPIVAMLLLVAISFVQNGLLFLAVVRGLAGRQR